MLYSELVNRAIDIAYKAHHGQFDKAGRPYVVHVIHVAEQMDDEISTCAALLNDTIEDTGITAEELEREFPVEVVELVKLLTRKDDTDYMDYVMEVSRNPKARKIKLADIEHNLDESRLYGCDEKMLEDFRIRRKKYEKARQFLREAGG